MSDRLPQQEAPKLRTLVSPPPTTPRLVEGSSHPREGSRVRIEVSGIVQGIGFRPFVYRLARELALTGWVRNSSAGVSLEIQGEPRAIGAFASRLQTEAPAMSRIASMSTSVLPIHQRGGSTFRIISSKEGAGPRSAIILPDLATC